MVRFTLLALMSLTFSFPAHAKKKISILGFEADEGLAKKARMATKLFRKYASGNPKLSLMKPIEIEEMKLMHCDSERDTAVACLKKISKEIGADILITGRVSKKAKQVKVSVSFLAGGAVRYTYKVFSASAKRRVYQAKIRELWFAFFKGMKSRVVVKSPVGGASVMVDGTFLFKTVPGDNEIPQITPGEHEIKVVSPEGIEFVKKVSVLSGEPLVIQVDFGAGTRAATGTNEADIAGKRESDAPPTKSSSFFANGSGFWKGTFIGSAIISAALLGGGIYFGLQVGKYEDDKKALLDSGNANHYGSDVCSDPTLKPICDDGKAAAANANIFIAAGAVVGLVSTYFLYKGFIATEPEVEGSADVAGGSGNVTVLPVLTQNGGGLSIGGRF